MEEFKGMQKQTQDAAERVLDLGEMSEKTAKIGVQAEGESAYSLEARAKIAEVRKNAREAGQDEDEAVRNFNANLTEEERSKLYGTNEGLVN